MRAIAMRIFEVGVRDGLQNEKKLVPTEVKAQLIRDLIATGITDLELGAFVRPDRVPQMADTDQLYDWVREGSLKLGQTRAWALVPNLKGFERAVRSGARGIAVFTAATESFAKKNIGMSIEESLTEIARVVDEARHRKIAVRGYVSTALGCPFEGKVPPKKALKVITRLMALGIEQVSIGDTIGVGTPREVDQVVAPALRHFGVKRIAVHFHDTRGTALANTLRAIEQGVRTVDSSAGGLGGCPFAPGAAGNLATEDLIYMLHGMGLQTGIDLDRLCAASIRLSQAMGRPLSSRYLQTFASQNAERQAVCD